MKKFLDLAGLQQLIGLIKDKFVQKESGKGLSTNDFTDEEKNKLSSVKAYTNATATDSGLLSPENLNKLDGIETGAEKNIISKIKRNGTILNVSSGEVNILVPQKISELVDDKGLQTKSDVQKLIADARTMKKQIVSKKPSTGEDNVLYLVGPKGSGNNIYEEYLYINSNWEKVGDTDTKVDLSGYVKQSEIQTITAAEITQAMGA